MSFGTVLADIYGGFGQGRQARDKENDSRTQLALSKQSQDWNQQYQQAELDRQAKTDAISKEQTDANLRLSGIDPTTGQALQGLTGLSPIPQLKAGQDSSPLFNWYLNAAATAASQGRPDLATQYTAQANAAGLGVSRLSTADLNTQKGTVIPSQIAVNNAKAAQGQAQAGYLKQRYGIDMAKINAQVQIAQQRDATQTSVAATNAQQRAASSLQTEQGRIYAVQLAQVYAAQYHNAQFGVQLAIAQAGDAERYAASTVGGANPASAGYNPTQQIQPSQQAPTIIPITIPQPPQYQPLIPDGHGGYTYPTTPGQQPLTNTNTNTHQPPVQPMTDQTFQPLQDAGVAKVKSDPSPNNLKATLALVDQTQGATPQQKARAKAAILAAAQQHAVVHAPVAPPRRPTAPGQIDLMNVAGGIGNGLSNFLSAQRQQNPRYQQR